MLNTNRHSGNLNEVLIRVASNRIPFGSIVLAIAVATSARAGNQTEDLSPVLVDGNLPYSIELTEVSLGGANLPTLHSFAAAEHAGLWVLIGGRTNGLHGFTGGGIGNFPPQSQNRDVWVIDPVSQQSWNRSLQDAASGLTTSQIDSLTPTNTQFCATGGRLYITGGYGFSLASAEFVTYDTLTAIDLGGLIAWTQGGSGAATDHIRQLSDPMFQVTGGTMHEMEGRFHLVFGQNFQGGYNPLREGIYTRQIRSFDIVDDGETLSIENASQSPSADAYRRRDLNVAATMRRITGEDTLEEGLVALAGVFTPTVGAWTVPVEIDSSGTPSMADPAASTTFKQSLNVYHSAKLGMYSEASDSMHILLFGGITLEFFDRSLQQTVKDDQMPFVNQVTALVVNAVGEYEQHVMPQTYPSIDSGNGELLRFGANAEFFATPGIDAYSNGVLKLDAITQPTTVGHIFGGIVADSGNNGNTAASGRIFAVVVAPNSTLLADFDSDGDVDGQDFLIWQNGFGTASGATREDGDANGDGSVDGQDFLIWQSEFGSTAAGAAAAAVSGPAPLLAPLRTVADAIRVKATAELKRTRRLPRRRILKRGRNG